jgi:hypothetical protein
VGHKQSPAVVSVSRRVDSCVESRFLGPRLRDHDTAVTPCSLLSAAACGWRLLDLDPVFSRCGHPASRRFSRSDNGPVALTICGESQHAEVTHDGSPKPAGLPAGEEYEAACQPADGAEGGLSPSLQALALLRYAGIFRAIGQRARAGTDTSADAKPRERSPTSTSTGPSGSCRGDMVKQRPCGQARVAVPYQLRGGCW